MTDENTIIGDEAAEDQFFEEGRKRELEEVEPEVPPQEPEASGEETEGDSGGDPEEPEGDEGKPPKGFVPHGALHQERMERKKLQEELQSVKQQYEGLTQLKTELEQWRANQAQQATQHQAEEAYQQDPIGYLRHQNEQLQQRLQQFEQGIQQTHEQHQQSVQQQQAMSQLVQTVRSHEETFKSQHPDYDEAFNFIQQRRQKDYDVMGLDPGRSQQAFYQEVLGVSVQALQQDRNPAEVMYEIARQWGFTGSANQQERKLETTKKGQAAAKSLSAGGGAPSNPNKKPSLNDIAQMPDDEFDALWNSMEKDARQRR